MVDGLGQGPAQRDRRPGRDEGQAGAMLRSRMGDGSVEHLGRVHGARISPQW
ncbi:hypothetical protein [Sphingobium sp. Sx8-8]|uniref:hypothetical protein n=1 Tax=Sphingobium sp. Sx8-8 TaxID=2933617 RepID=UPI001F582B19|nr:hypothetical protein [Sphingobium sp. Sx8-8]